MDRGSLQERRKRAFQTETMWFQLLSGIIIRFQMLSQTQGQVTHVLLTHPPLTRM